MGDAQKANAGDLSDKTIYYFLLDRDLYILGWMKEKLEK